jgi:hypothetical protein
VEYYSSLLVQLKDILKHILNVKRRVKVTKAFFVLHDNAPTPRALAAQKKLACCPDLVPPDYHLFPGLKKKSVDCSPFSSDAEVTSAAETWLDGQDFNFF